MKKTTRLVLQAGAALTAGLAAAGFWLASGPDYDLDLTRQLPSSVDLATLDTALGNVSAWPHWHHQTIEARVHGGPQQAAPGARVQFLIEPRGQKWRRFTLEAEVLEYQPGKLLRMKLLSDSTGRTIGSEGAQLTALEWAIELREGPPLKTWITGHVRARTAHWKSRLFGRIARRILMNQLLLPDLIKLGELTQPLSPVSPRPDSLKSPI